MDKATKTKIILFASLGIFVLVVLAVTLALTGKGDNREEDGSVNTSLRAQQQSDFTLDDMMNTDAGRSTRILPMKCTGNVRELCTGKIRK